MGEETDYHNMEEFHSKKGEITILSDYRITDVKEIDTQSPIVTNSIPQYHQIQYPPDVVNRLEEYQNWERRGFSITPRYAYAGTFPRVIEELHIDKIYVVASAYQRIELKPILLESDNLKSYFDVEDAEDLDIGESVLQYEEDGHWELSEGETKALLQILEKPAKRIKPKYLTDVDPLSHRIKVKTRIRRK